MSTSSVASENPIVRFALADVRAGESVDEWFDRANGAAWSEAGHPDDSAGSKWWETESEAWKFLETVPVG